MNRFARLGATALGFSFVGLTAWADAGQLTPEVGLTGLLGIFAGQPWAIYALLVAASLPWLAAVLPQASPGSGWAPARKLLDVLAGNVGNAANRALASPLFAAGVAKPLPQAIFGVEHAVQLVVAGIEAGKAQGASVPAPSPAPSGGAPVGGSVAAVLGIVAFALLLGLGACGKTAAVPLTGTVVSVPPTPKSPDEAVAEIQAGYVAALNLATSYALLPRCVAGVAPPCSDTAVVARIGAAQSAASKTLSAARAGLLAFDAIAAPSADDTSRVSALIDAATTAIGAFATIAKNPGA